MLEMYDHSDQHSKIASISVKIEVKDIKSKDDNAEKDNDAKNADKADFDKRNWKRSMGYQRSQSSNALETPKNNVTFMKYKNNTFNENKSQDGYETKQNDEETVKPKRLYDIS